MSIDKLQQAIIYNARKNEKEHKELDDKIKEVDNSINKIYEETISSDNELSQRIEEFNSKLDEVEQAIDDIELLEPEKGDKGDKGEKGDRGEQGIDGVNGIDGKDGRDGVDGLDGRDGKDGSPDTGEQIVAKINSQNEQIDYTKIKNLPAPKIEVREIYTSGGGGGFETIKNNGTTISNSTKSLNFIGPDLTKQSDNVSIDFSKYALNSIFANYVPYTGATGNVDLGLNSLTANAVTLGTGTVLTAGSFSNSTTLDFKAGLNTGDNAFRMQFYESLASGIKNSGGYIQYNSLANYLEFGGIQTITGTDVPGFRIDRDTGVATFFGVNLPAQTSIGGGAIEYTQDVALTLAGKTNSATAARLNLWELGAGSGGFVKYNGSSNQLQIGTQTDTLTETLAISINRGTSVVDFSSAITTGKVIGGSAVGASLALQPTTGNGTLTGQAIKFLVGNNGATQAMTILNNGNVGVNTLAPTFSFDVKGTTLTNNINTDTGLNFNFVSAPVFGAGDLALTSGGSNLGIGVYNYVITYTTALGETQISTTRSITTDASNRKVTITLPVSTDYRVTGRKIYRTAVGAGATLLYPLATIANNTDVSYVDDIADASLGTLLAYFRNNTTNGTILVNGVRTITLPASGNGSLFMGYNTGPSNLANYSGGINVGIGTNVLKDITSGYGNTCIGADGSGSKITTGRNNTTYGLGTGSNITTGLNNTLMGEYAGINANFSNTTAIGARANYLGTSNSTFLGFYAGRYETVNNKLIIDSLNRSDEATSRSQALIYGVFNATAASQILSLGGGGKVGIGTTSPATTLEVNGIIKTTPRASATCDVNSKGGIYFDSDDNHFYGCDGTDWKQLDN